MESIILQCISAIIQPALVTYYLVTVSKVLTKEDYPKKKIGLVYGIVLINFLISFLLGIIPNLSIEIVTMIKPLLGFSFVFIASKYILNVKSLKAVLVSIFNFILFAVTEIIVAYTLKTIFKFTFNETMTLKFYLPFIIVQALLIFAILQLSIKVLSVHIPNPDLFANMNSKQVVTIISLLIICILPQILLLAFNLYEFSLPFLVINSFQIIIICITLFIFLKRTIERDKSQSDLVTSQVHNKTMVGMVDGIRTLKHDYNNIMQALNGYVSTKQYDRLQEHINKVLEECNIVNNLSVIDPKIFNDPAIYGIIGAKFFLATESEIKFDLDIITVINEINFPMPELSRILGILLDNAMEATSKINDKYIRLEMKYDVRKSADVIRVVNTYDTSINIDMINIYKKGYSSKEEKSGIGLWEVKKLIAKQRNSQIFPTVEGNCFVQNIVIEKGT